jgi:hypothetical protein
MKIKGTCNANKCHKPSEFIVSWVANPEKYTATFCEEHYRSILTGHYCQVKSINGLPLKEADQPR